MSASTQNHRKVQRVLVNANQSKLPTKLEIIQSPAGTFRWHGNDGKFWSVRKLSLGAAINELTSGQLAVQTN